MFPCLINHLSLVPRLYQLVRCITLRQLAAIITRSHDFTVSPGRTQSQKVAAMATVEVECLDKYIARLADRAYNVVGFLALVAAQVLNGMESLIEGG